MERLIDLLKSGYGWLLIATLTLWNYIGAERGTFIIVFAAIIFDLFWGVWCAIKLKRFIVSEALRETPKKIFIYIGSLLIVYAIEHNIHDSYLIGTKIIGTIMAACELWSASAHMLIIKPNMPFIKLFRKQLKGEISKKTGIDESKIDEIFE